MRYSAKHAFSPPFTPKRGKRTSWGGKLSRVASGRCLNTTSETFTHFGILPKFCASLLSYQLWLFTKSDLADISLPLRVDSFFGSIFTTLVAKPSIIHYIVCSFLFFFLVPIFHFRAWPCCQSNNVFTFIDRFDEVHIAANSFLFFVAGFETTASTLSYCLYELAINQSIQDRLRTELENAYNKHNQCFNDEMLKEISYLDAVIAGMQVYLM